MVRKVIRGMVLALVVVAMMAFSGGPALAGWGWEDCPPASGKGLDNMSSTAYEWLKDLEAPEVANTHARDENPGAKPKPVVRTGN